MTIEIFKLDMPEQFFIFISTEKEYRLDALVKSLNGLNAKHVGPGCVAVRKDNATPEDIRDALGDLVEGECVYVIGAAGDTLENHLLVAPRVDGGIIVR